MHLVVGGNRISVAQAGPDFVMLDATVDVPPMAAELVTDIDGVEKRRQVFLPAGVRLSASKTPIASL